MEELKLIPTDKLLEELENRSEVFMYYFIQPNSERGAQVYRGLDSCNDEIYAYMEWLRCRCEDTSYSEVTEEED